MRAKAFLLILTGTASLFAQSSPSYSVTHTYVLGGDGSWDYVIPDPPNHRLFIARQNRVMVVDEDKGTLIGEVAGIQGAHGTAIAQATGHGFATQGDDQSVAMFDLKTFKVIGRIPHRLFSGCRSGVMAVSDYQAGKVVATLPIGTGVDGAGFDAASGDVFTSNADGTLTVIHQDSPDKYYVVENVPTPQGSRNMGLDPTSHRVFIVSAKFGPAPAGGRGRGTVLPGSFTLMTIERGSSAH
jgi:hypothetical protein